MANLSLLSMPGQLSWQLILTCALFPMSAIADGPADNQAESVRRIPPPGIALKEADRAELQAGLDELRNKIEHIEAVASHQRFGLLKSLPDIQIFQKAVSSALARQEFFSEREIERARKLLKQGDDRAMEVIDRNWKWTRATGLVVRGYQSRIDGSIQPYGLVVPRSFAPGTNRRYRLDVWCHGRGETLSELNFLDERLNRHGEFTPPDTIVLHPYGRYCNANKFAGEIDLFEAIEDVKKNYPIDEDRLVMRGFSMGGAACWQFAVHYPTVWAASAPGAGFSETPEFLRVFQKESVSPPWYERKLWHLYNSTDYAVNLSNCPTVAYSGSKDRQKQAADLMAKALEAEGLDLVHIIGKDAGHEYTAGAREEINRRIDAIAEIGRVRVPPRVRFTTWTLRYNRCAWIELDGLDRHWERARIEAELVGKHGAGPELKTQNVAALSISFSPGQYLPEYRPRSDQPSRVKIDDQLIDAPRPRSDRSWMAHFRKVDGSWQSVPSPEDGTLRKRHGLQGPIDDAFMDSFLMVRPTGKAANDRVGKWVASELDHAIEHWRRQFRGEPRVEDDKSVRDLDISMHNLILWGDPSSNQILARIVANLPLKWEGDQIELAGDRFDASHHVPVLIFPNPLNPARYVVLNSGFTFREYDYLNNARQVPKLPDFAIIDIDTPISPRAPGRVATAGFFNEQWKIDALSRGGE